MYEAGLRNKVNMILDGTIASQRLDPSDWRHAFHFQ
jgi:hypothetical protein